LNQEEIIKQLREPFDFKDIVWELQHIPQEDGWGRVVACLDARAIQKRLDDTVGTFGWKNVNSTDPGATPICGISIFNTESNEWVTKFDSEPILDRSRNSFKRAACIWGIGRYLHQVDDIEVEIEPNGESFVIKPSQFSRLEAEYRQDVAKIFSTISELDETLSNDSANQPSTALKLQAESDDVPNGTESEDAWPNASFDYKVRSCKPSGKNSQLLELIAQDGEILTAYVKTGEQAIEAGLFMQNVCMEKKVGNYGPYNLITSYGAA